ncbi:MAG TPA: hypothetical protein VK986_26155 [Tepidisphaeraceae bacterium]|nr:hypothetical protein [Tepidisphaeraceae bacterium]
MTPRRLRQLAANPGNIPGVYNYCDRWCERCPLTARCLNFQMEQEERAGEDPAARDVANQAFWDTLTNSFQLTIEMIREDCAERGIDFDKLVSESGDTPRVQKKIEQGKARRAQAKEHPLVEAAHDYTMTAHKWLAEHRDAFEAAADSLVSAHLARLPGHTESHVGSLAASLADALDVVRWYHTMIPPKTYRAVSQHPVESKVAHDPDDPFADLMDEAGDDDPESRQAEHDARDSDANGSAKVALISIDRSLDAWARLRAHLPDHGDAIIDFLVRLDRLRRETERLFPKARAFVRPGFDDAPDGISRATSPPPRSPPFPSPAGPS